MMNRDCRAFREQLLEALGGKPCPTELRTLSWHEHLLGCEDCRCELEREEALEGLLATLPEPKLPPELTKRVVMRLGLRRAELQDGSPLDSLLELDQARADVPAGLADRIRAGLAAERALDGLLERWSTPQASLGLAPRVLAALDEYRAPRSTRRQILIRAPRYAAAAALLLGLLSTPWWTGARDSTQTPAGVVQVETPSATGVPLVDASLLEVLDVLENDSLWAETDTGSVALVEEADLHLFLEARVAEGDEILLAFLPSDVDSARAGDLSDG